MAVLLDIPIPDRHISIYDPACGTGGMLSVAKEQLLDRANTLAERGRVEKFVTVHGGELSPIVTTQQKFAWVLEEIEKNPELKSLRVAFLIDEAHRSQEGRMGVAIRVPFRKPGDPDAEDAEDDGRDDEEQIAKIIREHDRN